jgi:glutaminyl-tRNA synthetase
MDKSAKPAPQITNFIKNRIEEDLKKDKSLKIKTRFPPEPNGYLHIGHAKSICLNFGLAKTYEEATCNLRFDDTNPTKEDMEYVEAIQEDITWLGYHWDGDIRYASQYFDFLYESALKLIKKDLAYVCELSPEKIRETRGTLTEPGTESPFRKRSVEENLKLFAQMKEGFFEEGKAVLRAKIDMASGNINMRDPVLYRVLKKEHHQTGDTWCIYPMYDFAHALSDAYEEITHSLCTLEFADHRPLYNWCVENVGTKGKPEQIEFSRLELNYTVTSKRKLKELVDSKTVNGWDDPRLLTIKGLRRRGYTPDSLRNFCEIVGISKKNTVIDMSILEEAVRDDLNEKALRKMTVMNPLKVVLTNYPQDKKEILTAQNHPQREELGKRDLPFSRVLYIEQDDYMENPPKDYFRLSEGQEVRLRYAYVIKCEKALKDPVTGQVVELHCTYDEKTLGQKPEGRKVQGIIHWLSEDNTKNAEVRLYDRLFTVENPSKEEENYLDFINPDSFSLCSNALVEKSLEYQDDQTKFQFERLGYFSFDQDSTKERLVFNKTVSLKDTWKKG